MVRTHISIAHELLLMLCFPGNTVCRRLMEEDDKIAKRRADLQLEKERLDGFSKRLTDLIRQINEPEPHMPQQFSSTERDDLPVSEYRRASDGTNESDTVMEESNGEVDMEDTIILDLAKKRRRSYAATVVEYPEI